MSLIALILLLAGAGLLLGRLHAWNSHRLRRSRAGLLTSFSRLGSCHNLSFTSQEILADRILGFDGLNKKLLVLEKRAGHYDWFTINMEDVESCTVMSVYHWDKVSERTQKRLDERVSKIALVFCFKKEARPIELPFYTSETNELCELRMLEAKARGWESFLTKLLTHNQTGRA
jgi:hypothetical protein